MLKLMVRKYLQFYAENLFLLFQKPTAGTQLPGVKEESPSKISVGEPNDNSTGNILSISLHSMY